MIGCNFDLLTYCMSDITCFELMVNSSVLITVSCFCFVFLFYRQLLLYSILSEISKIMVKESKMMVKKYNATYII